MVQRKSSSRSAVRCRVLELGDVPRRLPDFDLGGRQRLAHRLCVRRVDQGRRCHRTPSRSGPRGLQDAPSTPRHRPCCRSVERWRTGRSGVAPPRPTAGRRPERRAGSARGSARGRRRGRPADDPPPSARWTRAYATGRALGVSPATRCRAAAGSAGSRRTRRPGRAGTAPRPVRDGAAPPRTAIRPPSELPDQHRIPDAQARSGP